MNSKSVLSEWCQINKQEFPEYQSYAVGGEAHAPLYRGECIVMSQTFVTDDTYKSKREADQAVASIALKNYARSVATTNTTCKIQDDDLGVAKYILLIDLDNQNQFKKYIPALLQMENKQSLYIGIGGPLIDLPTELIGTDQRFRFRKTNLLSKDATDIELAFEAAKLVNGSSNDYIVRVFSKDYALSAISEILKRNGLSSNFECDIVKWVKNPT
jgi:hypothetical protein